MPVIDISFPNNHPSADGHFPGNPIIPGAVLLAEVLHAIEREIGETGLPYAIKAAKFFSPARPGDCVRIECSVNDSGSVKFTCGVEGRAVLSGQVEAVSA